MNRIYRLTHEKKRIDYTYTNQFAWKVISDGAWKGKPCFIIGGGPSLTDFNWDLLKGKLTIGINRVYEKIDPTIIYGQDPRFVRWILMGKYGDTAKTKFLQSPALKIWLNTTGEHLPEKIYILKCWRNYVEARSAFPLTMKEGIGHGSNSGYGALNLAACLGANPIYLLGYDMQRENERTHWHDGHPERTPDHVPESFKKHFISAAEFLEKKNICVINLNPKSALTCFPKAEPISVLNFVAPPQPQQEYRIESTSPSEEKIKRSIYVAGYYGFGDNLNERPLIRHLTKKYETVYLRTPMPEIFWDIPRLKFVYPKAMNLRTQKKHMDSLPESTWSDVPVDAERYGEPLHGFRIDRSTTKFYELTVPQDEYDYHLPLKREWIEAGEKILVQLRRKAKGKKLCIIRQPAYRKEWNCLARDPDPKYFQFLIDKFKNRCYFVSIADIKEGEEWFLGGKLKGINKSFDYGELPLTTLLAVVQGADIMVCYPSFFLLLGIALRTKTLCIFGGNTPPDKLTDPDMDLRYFTAVTPKPFCDCYKKNHDCNKNINTTALLAEFTELLKKRRFVKKVNIGIVSGWGDMNWIFAKMESFKERKGIDKLKLVIHKNERFIKHYIDLIKLVPFIDSVEQRKTMPLIYYDGYRDKPFYSKQDEMMKRECLDYVMQLNTPMENGLTLEETMPEYEVNYDYPLLYPKRSKEFALNIKKKVGGRLFLLYGSCRGRFRFWAMKTWMPKDWMAVIKDIHSATGCRPVLVGGNWDRELYDELNGCDPSIKSSIGNKCAVLDKDNLAYDLIGKTTMAEIMALIREANAVVGFSSGLTMMATHFMTPAIIFWSTKGITPKGLFKKEFQTCWVDPRVMERGLYMPLSLGSSQCTANGVIDMIRAFYRRQI